MKIFVALILMLMVPMAFGNEAWEAFHKEYRKVYRKASTTSKIELIKKFGQFDIQEAAEELMSEMDKLTLSIELKIAISNVLINYKSKEVQDFLINYIKKQSNPDSFVVYTLYKKNLPEANEIFANYIFRATNVETIAISLRALGQQKTQKEEVINKIIARTDKKEDISVRKSAVEALGGISSTLGAAKLVELLSDKILNSIAVDSLERLTGKLLGNDSKAWDAWLAKNPNFKPVNSPLESFMKEKFTRNEKAKKDLNKESAAGSSEFYGMPVTGQNIMFVLDRSGSMTAPAKSFPTRMEQLKAEFIQMIEGIPNGTNLGIIMFPHDVYPHKGIDSVDDKFKEQIKNYITDLKPIGSTPTAEAMTYLFEKVADKRQIDTIYLLSDGVPNTPPEDVRKLIQGLNTSKYIQINTISIGENSQFLKDVAADNNGSYLFIP